MTTYELLATVAGLGGLAAASVGVIVSVVSIKRTRKLDSQQSNLQKKQIELTELQLELTKRQAAGAGPTPTAPTADVRVALEGISPNYRFVITNWGAAPAHDVRVDIAPLGDRPSPLVNGDYAEKIPIPTLAVGAQCNLLAAITFGTGTVFEATWGWANPDGTTEQRESRLTLP